MNLKDATIRSTRANIDALITEKWVTFRLDDPDNKEFVNQMAGMQQFCSSSARGVVHSPPFCHIYTAADAKIPAEVAALGTTQLKTGLGDSSCWEDAKRSQYRSP